MSSSASLSGIFGANSYNNQAIVFLEVRSPMRFRRWTMDRIEWDWYGTWVIDWLLEDCPLEDVRHLGKSLLKGQSRN